MFPATCELDFDSAGASSIESLVWPIVNIYRQIEFLGLQLGNPAATGNHHRDPLAQVFQANAAARPFFDPQLIPRNAQIAVNQESLQLALRPPAKFQGACIVV